MLKITHKVRVKFFIGNYIDTVDCDIAPLSAWHLLLGRPWQFDLDATHGGHSNTYSFVHKGMSHVLKPMMETAIKVDIFPAVRKKKKDPPMDTLKPRTALLQGEENDVTISNTSDEPPTKEGPWIISKPRTVLLKGGENIMTTISAPNTVAVNSINPIQIQFGTLSHQVVSNFRSPVRYYRVPFSLVAVSHT
jgi:hypothetical protein